MTDHLLSPDRSVEIGGAAYTLDGSFRTLKAIQETAGRDILSVLADALQLRLRFDELAAILRLGMASPPPLEEIERAVVEDIGINQTAYLVMEWLVAATSPKKERAGNVQGVLKAVNAIEAARKAPRKK